MVKIKTNNKKISKKELKQLQNSISAIFPKEYIDFLTKYNGGILESNIVKINNDEIKSFSISEFLGIGLKSTDDIIYKLNLIKEGLPTGFIPIAGAVGGNVVCINLNAEGYGQILLWDHETEDLYNISKSFLDFIDMIDEYDSDKDDLSGYLVEEVWIDPDFLKELENESN